MNKFQKIIKINPIDLIATAIVVLLVLVFVLGATLEKTQTGKPTTITVEITDPNQVELIYPEAKKLGNVYLNSVNAPVEVVNVIKDSDKLDIEITGPGEIENGKYLFNGKRVLVGQKAEIHAGYFAQGYIKSVKYAD